MLFGRKSIDFVTLNLPGCVKLPLSSWHDSFAAHFILILLLILGAFTNLCMYQVVVMLEG